MKVYVVVGVALASSGCAQWLTPEPSRLADEVVECRYEVPVGSVIRKRVCRTASETAAESARGRATLDYNERQRQTSMMMERRRGG